jgi:hypothetical protein
MNVIRIAMMLGALSLLACSDDGDESAGAFPGVSKWKCFQDGDTSCECHGLGPNDDYVSSGPNIMEVAACPASMGVCQTYKDDFGDWACECRPAAFTPTDATDVADAAKCPP